jgi:hypothetical protein
MQQGEQYEHEARRIMGYGTTSPMPRPNDDDGYLEQMSRAVFLAGLNWKVIALKGYSDDELPTAETIATKLNSLGYYPKKVTKSQPQKTPRDRCHLRPGEAAQRGSRCREGRVTTLDGCQGYRQSQPFCP